MRVIAGIAKRTVLVSPQGLTTRPTSGRAKESLFSILGLKVKGAVVLDIFCGSGAIGIEALSRGASSAVFVDNSIHAKKAVTANLDKTKLQGEVITGTAANAIKELNAKNRRFDIIFLDPPYDTNLLTETLHDLARSNILANDTIIIAETDSKFEPTIPSVFAIESTRIYGRTKFLFLHYI